MKSLWYGIVFLLVLHALAAIGLVAWLGASGRINRERVDKVTEVFALTLKQEEEKAAEEAKDAEKAKQNAEELARLEGASEGPVTVADRLRDDQQARELTLRKIERLKSELEALQRNLRFTRDQLSSAKKRFEEERKAFEQFRQRELGLAKDESFKEAVRTYENLKPKQTKAIFQQMLALGKHDEVVELLVSMQLRKRAAVLDAFKEDEEVAQATDLIERLRIRGAEMTSAAPTQGQGT